MFYCNENLSATPDHELSWMQVVNSDFFPPSGRRGPYVFQNVPTHTEDGIPIRKLYISNLPPNTTRSELFSIFAQYGFIMNCWLKLNDNGTFKPPTPSFAFVTYSNPADAHSALKAPASEKTLRGRNLKISPADSWHQPTEKSYGVLQTKPRQRKSNNNSAVKKNSDINTKNLESALENAHASNEEATNSEIKVVSEEEVDSKNILNMLNMDCLTCILDYVPIRELILSERVSKGWRNMISQYFSNVRLFKTSMWDQMPVRLTTAGFRRILQRVGNSLTRLHIDQVWSMLNDRTAHTIGKFCPELEEIHVVNMNSKNWNPLVYGCQKLRSVSFSSCNKLTDTNLVQIVKNISSIDSVAVISNVSVTGLFLTNFDQTRIKSLTFDNCLKIEASILSVALSVCCNLTILKIESCRFDIWKIIPDVLKKLPKLQELSLCDFMYEVNRYSDIEITPYEKEFCEAISTLTRLKKLNLSKNVQITNAVLQQVAESCPYLECLNLSNCNFKYGKSQEGVGNEGVSAVCRGCTVLRELDVSHLSLLTNAGLRNLSMLTCLTHFTARGNVALKASAITPCIASCHRLRHVDLRGCKSLCIEEIVTAAVTALNSHPRVMMMRLAGTTPILEAAMMNELRNHKLLKLDIFNDRSNEYLRSNIVNYLYGDSDCDDSFNDLFDDPDDFFDDPYMSDDLEDYEDLLEDLLPPSELILFA